MANFSAAGSPQSRFNVGTGRDVDLKAAKLVGDGLGRCLQIEWDRPASLDGSLGEAVALQRKAVAENSKNISTLDEPYHPYTLSGQYHTYRIANKYPIPGGTIEDDVARTAAANFEDGRYSNAGEAERKAIETKGRAMAEAAGIAVKRLDNVIRETDYTKLLPVVLQQEEQDRKDHHLRMIHAPDWKTTDVFPLQPSDREVFDLIKANSVQEMLGRFGRMDVVLNGVDPVTLQTGVMRCALLGREEIMKMYVDAGCDLNIKSTTGNTVLHYIFDAVLHIKGPEVPLEHKRGRQAICRMVRYLIKHGANVNAKNLKGETPLHLAAYRDLGLAVKLLLEAGADFYHKRQDGKDAMLIAYEANAMDAMCVLKNWDTIKFYAKIEPVAREIFEKGNPPPAALPVVSEGGDIIQRKRRTMLLEAQEKFDHGKASVLTEAVAGPTITVPNDAEKTMSADDLVARWNLMLRWIDRERDEAQTANSVLAPTPIKVAELDYNDQLRPLRQKQKDQFAGRVVLASRRLAATDAANHGSQWFDIGPRGRKEVERQERLLDKVGNSKYRDDEVSVMAQEDREAVTAHSTSRPVTKQQRMSTAQRDADESMMVHNAAMLKVMMDAGVELPPESNSRLGTATATRLGVQDMAPSPRRLAAQLLMEDAEHSHIPRLKDAEGTRKPKSFEKRGEVTGDLLFPYEEYSGYKRTAMALTAKNRTKAYQKNVKSASELVASQFDYPTPKKEITAPRNDLEKRRRAVAATLLQDAPSIEYNVKYTHIVDDRVMTRRPAILSSALRPARIRADILHSEAFDIRDGDTDVLTKLVVGVRPHHEKEQQEGLLIVEEED